ncbi:MAG TPA: Uma2 family endonuclease [Thermoanaerobaculia bacterium]
MARRSDYTPPMADPVRKQPAGGVLDDDPFFYGSRWISVRLPDGRIVDEQIPLTPDDLLDPQPGDQVTQSDKHFELVGWLFRLLKRHFDSREDIKVTGDLKMIWGIPKLREPSPDVAVIPKVRDKHKERESFNVQQEGTRPCLIIEVVSSKDAETRRNDYENKVQIYERAGIPEYLICDPPTRFTRDRLLLTGYRLGRDGKYRRIEPDERGFLHSETTDLLFGIAENRRTLLVIDAMTGERLLADEEATQEAKEQARREAGARKAAEERARAAEEQARAAEEQARSEIEAREAMAAELARLRAELERLKKP